MLEIPVGGRIRFRIEGSRHFKVARITGSWLSLSGARSAMCLAVVGVLLASAE